MPISNRERERRREINRLARYAKTMGSKRYLSDDEIANTLEKAASAQLSELLLKGESTATFAEITRAMEAAAKIRGDVVVSSNEAREAANAQVTFEPYPDLGEE